jgi:diguanylate cyclase (GGDEF)-like protein
MAVRDGLTALFNHRHFQEALAQELARSSRSGKPCSIVFMDVDNFKAYNDTHGHPDGDKLLRTLSEILTSQLRCSDLAARYGGEEFVLLLPETPKAAALRIAETLRAKVEREHFPGRERQPLGRVTISAGVACYPEDGRDTQTLLGCADQRLYQAKNGGRNQVVG